MDDTESSSRKYSWWISFIFILLAISFILDIWPSPPEVIKRPSVAEEYFTKDPVRLTKLQPRLYIDGESYSCNECHDQLEPSQIQKSYFSAHPDIILDHGVNNYCTTCHSLINREKLIDINKRDVSFAQSEKTCLQCHGPIYRDWESGVHGRMNDYWDDRKGIVRKLTCVQCHDPHQPKFKSMKPAPGPNIKNYKYFLDSISIKDKPHG